MAQYLVTAYADDTARVVLDLTSEQADGIARLAQALDREPGYVPTLNIRPVDAMDPSELPYPYGQA